MDEIEPFIKIARSSLGAFGSKSVSYREFLETYKKDSDGKNFDQEACNAGYKDGLEALNYYENIFEVNGDFVRRIDTAGIGHIISAVDNSKKTNNKKKPLPKRPGLSANRQFFRTPLVFTKSEQQSSYGQRQTAYPNWSTGGGYGHYRPPSAQRPVQRLQYPSASNGVAVPQFRPAQQATSQFRPTWSGTAAASQPRPAQRPASQVFSNRQPALTSNGITATLPDTKPTAAPRVKEESADKTPIRVSDGPAGYDNRTFGELMDTVGGHVFKMLKDIYSQGLTSPLKPDKLYSIIKVHKLDTAFSLSKLKSFLVAYLSPSFHLITVDENSISLQSNRNNQLKSEYQFLRPMSAQKMKQSQLQINRIYSCRILDANQEGENGSLRIYLRPLEWTEQYPKLCDELKRYAQMRDLLTPIDLVFRFDRLLYFDEATKTFYRCFILSSKSPTTVEVFFTDEAVFCTVKLSGLYMMPVRFHKYHDMCFALNVGDASLNDKFGLIVEHLKKCATKEHSAEVMIGQFENHKLGAATYRGAFSKVVATDSE